jgi:hypothetical protein
MWQLLVSPMVADRLLGVRSARTITYGELAMAMDKSPKAAITLSRQLWIIGEYCKRVGLPALNAIVVNQETGLPGEHVVLSAGKSPKEEIKSVLKFDWSRIAPPTAGRLLKVWNEISS